LVDRFRNATGLGQFGEGTSAEVDQAIGKVKAQMQQRYNDLGTRFELVVDAQSNQPITVGTAGRYLK